jgi:tetratricopeptide (TPR) repeat protein
MKTRDPTMTATPRTWTLCLLLTAAALGLQGCERMQETVERIDAMRPEPLTIETLRDSYARGDHETALRQGRSLAEGRTGNERAEAAYIAGLSALRLERPHTAIPLLETAAEARDWSLAGDAKLQLGLVYGQVGRHRSAAAALLDAAKYLDGQKRGDAYYHAAMSQRELGHLEDARAHLILARAHSPVEDRRRAAEAALGATGFTLQVATYQDHEQARQRARELARETERYVYGSPRVVTETLGRGDVGLVVHHVQIGFFPSPWSAADARRIMGAAGAVIVPVE